MTDFLILTLLALTALFLLMFTVLIAYMLFSLLCEDYEERQAKKRKQESDRSRYEFYRKTTGEK